MCHPRNNYGILVLFDFQVFSFSISEGDYMRGKSVCVVNDLTTDEQHHLYRTAGDVKKLLSRGEYPRNMQSKCAYLMFFEDSTRTKESFRNAAETLSFRTNIFDSASSSLNKFETVNDTVRMLCGYTAMQSVFIIRSKVEGLCRSLGDSISEYSKRAGIETPSFVNAGDGKHEHPTQEFLDEFSFLEQLGGSTDRIHIALVGDLLLGRTVHSKADGLRIFKNVTVDLVAPKELQLPTDYLSKMKANGFLITTYLSLDEYLSQSDVAPVLYFTRLQLERMDKATIAKEFELRKATTLRMEMLSKLPRGAKIYHPLPRHGEMPEIPFEVDRTEFNGYDEQSRNGYFLRTALLGLLTGIYEDLPQSPVSPIANTKIPSLSDATPIPLESVNLFFKTAAGANPSITAWIEVAFPQGTCPSKVRKAISRMRVLSNMEIEDGFCQISGNLGFHTILPRLVSDPAWMKFFFVFFAGCSPRVVIEGAKGEFRVVRCSDSRFPAISDLPHLTCPNNACVSHPDSKQRDVPASFESSKLHQEKFTCRYCEKEVAGTEMFS